MSRKPVLLWGGAIIAGLLLLTVLYPQAVFQGKIFGSPDSVAPAGFAEVAAASGESDARWNPYIFGGMPAFASLSFNSGLYLPNRIIRLGIDYLGLPPLAWLLLHYLWALLGIFVFLKAHGVRPWLAWLAGAAFILMPSQVAIGAYGHGSKVMTLAWIPWVLHFTDRVAMSGTLAGLLRQAALLALAVAGMLLAAHVQVAWYGLFTAGLYAVFRLALRLRRDKPVSVLASLAAGLVALLLAALLIAPLYAPVHEYSSHSIRGSGETGGAALDYATKWSLHPAEWTTFLLPSSCGFGEDTYFGHMPMTNYPNYLGVLPFLAALFLFFRGPGRPMDFFFAGLLLLSTLVAAGRFFTPIYNLFYDFLPWFNRFRVPVMILILQQLALVFLFARGMQRVLDDRSRSFQYFLAAAALLLAAVALLGGSLIENLVRDGLATRYAAQLRGANSLQVKQALAPLVESSRNWITTESLRGALLLAFPLLALEWRRRRDGKMGEALLGLALLLVLLVDFLPLANRVLHPSDHWKSREQVELWVKPEPVAERLPSNTLAFLEQNLGSDRFYALPGSALAGNEAASRGLASLGGYHAAKMALADSVLAAIPRGGLELLGRFSVRYLLSPRQLPAMAGLTEARAGGQGEEFIYEITARRPRLFLADSCRVESAFSARESLLGGKAGALLSLDAAPQPAPVSGEGKAGSISNAKFGLDRISCLVELKRPAILVLSDMQYPGWRARVGDEDRRLLTADGFMRGLPLAAGTHEVSFLFEPSGHEARRTGGGAAVAVIILGLLASFVVPGRRKKGELS